VSQESVLDSLLFIIYINDIVKVCPDKYNIKMFADDTLIYMSGDGNKELKRKMNMVFNIIEKCVSVNKLKTNAQKTKCMIVKSIRKKQRSHLEIF